MTMFNEAKAAQMAAYLLSKSGGSMNYTKLMKLLYLTDRESMRVTGASMTNDQPYSLKHGPVLSLTLDLLHGKLKSQRWSGLVRTEGYDAKLARTMQEDDLDELSPFGMKILDEVYARFGGMGWNALCRWTHDNCAEWKDPGSSRIPIAPGDVFEALGWAPEQAQQLASQYDEQRELDRTLANFN
jgi:uncharacterized phage-associated protein